jgi:hypothetical protein
LGDYYTNPVRHPEDVGVGVLRRTFTFDMAALVSTNGLPIGALEAGTIPLHVQAYVETAFNGTTPTLDVGVPGTVAGFAATAGIAPGATGFKGSLTGTLTGIPLAANTVVYVKQGGTGQTTGKATVVLTFVNKREGTGTAFPAN